MKLLMMWPGAAGHASRSTSSRKLSGCTKRIRRHSAPRTGDAALAEVNHLLLEMRSLAVRSASTHTDSDRVSYNDSFSHFNREIQTIADRTEIFGIGIFQSEGLGKQLQIEMEPFRPLMLQLKTFGTQQIARYASRDRTRESSGVAVWRVVYQRCQNSRDIR